MSGTALDAVQNVGTYFSGAPSSSSVKGNMGYMHDPNQAAYQINGLGDYQNNETALANQAQGFYNTNASSPLVTQGQSQQMDAYNQLANMANGQGPSLARANLQAGLNQQNAALQSQAMSSAGGAGAGNSQRNLLNAEANAGVNVTNQAAQASVAEQLGAMQRQESAANAIRQSAMGQQQLNMANQQALYGNQQNAYNSILNSNLAQTQANMGYDNALTNEGLAKSNVGLQGTGSGAQAQYGFLKTLGSFWAGLQHSNSGGGSGGGSSSDDEEGGDE